MNLIEQLGSYEAAKVAALNYRNSGDVLTAQKIESACLEHRRANDIFEVGDLVVSTLEGNEFWMKLVCEIEAFHKKMAITKSGGHIIHHYDFRHATPEEIKSGRRL